MKKRKTVDTKEIEKIFSKKTSADLERIRKIYSNPETLKKIKKLWTGRV